MTELHSNQTVRYCDNCGISSKDTIWSINFAFCPYCGVQLTKGGIGNVS